MNKKYIISACAILAFAACSSDDALLEGGTNTPSVGEIAVFTSTIDEDYVQLGEENLDGKISETRSTLDLESLDAIWQEGDRVSICDGTLNFSYKVRETGHTCSFDVVDEEHMGLTISDDAKFCAFYPSAAVDGWNGNTVTSMIYTEQDYQENYSPSDLSKQCFGGYMAAPTGTIDGENVSFKFNLVSSIVDVNLASFGKALNTVEAVYLKANNGETLAGKLKYNCDTKVITVDQTSTGYTTSSQSDVICVHVGGNMKNGATGEAAYVRFYTLPVVVSKGFTVTVKTTDGTYYTKSTSLSVGDGSTVTLSGMDNGTACKPYYKRLGFGAYNATNCRTGCWMATIPSNTHFNLISLPGAHNAATATVSGLGSGLAKCQYYGLNDLLSKGVRAFDIRPGVNSSNLTIYHGGYSCEMTFAQALSTFNTWLDANPTETVFVLVKPEKSSLTGTANANDAWKSGVGAALFDVEDHIAMIGGTKMLNDVKGKMVVIAAENTTAAAGNIGVGRVGWGGSYQDKTVIKGLDGNGDFGWTLVYQDESGSAAKDRASQLESFLTEYIVKNETNASRLYFSSANCESSIESSAKTVNGNLVNSDTFKNSTGRWGIVSFDFCGYSTDNGDKLLNMIINQNYKYLYKGRTRNIGDATEGIGVGVAGDEYADGTQVFARPM